MKKRTGVLLLVFGVLCLLGAAGVLAYGVVYFIGKLDPIVTVTSPGDRTFRVDQPGKFSLWHDYQTFHNGSSHRHDPVLPAGISFELTGATRGRAIPLAPFTTNQTLSSGQRQSTGVGYFEIPAAGDYTLRASTTANDERIFSLTEGTMLETIMPFGASIGIASLLGLLGLVLVIVGVIGMVASKRRQAAPPPSPQAPLGS